MSNALNQFNVVMVSYLNSKPFLYGLQHHAPAHQFKIALAPPSLCASTFLENKADLALIPVGALATIGDHKIVTKYCIGCDGAVRTVCLFSNTPLDEITVVYLDEDSRTSVIFTKILFDSYFKKTVKYVNAIKYQNLKHGEAALLIGDKVFYIEHTFAYKYDIGEIWKLWTGLPIAFAVWVAKPWIEPQVIDTLDNALKYGLSHMEEAIAPYKTEHLDLDSYFRNNIDYVLDDKKLQSLQLFMEKRQTLKI